MIKCKFEERPAKPVKTAHVYQWDYNQTLRITDIPKGITVSPEIHFWQEGLTEALVVTSTLCSDGDALTVVIPNILFQEPENIKVYVYEEEANVRGQTIAVYQIPVKEREVPADYEYIDNVDTTLSKSIKEIKERLDGYDAVIDELREKHKLEETNKPYALGQDETTGKIYIRVED